MTVLLRPRSSQTLGNQPRDLILYLHALKVIVLLVAHKPQPQPILASLRLDHPGAT